MTTFWIFIALVMLVGLMLIWIPHFRQQKLLKTEEAGVRKQTNLELFNERLGVLEKELSEELLDQAEFDALKKELEISLLQDIKQANDDSLVNQIKPKTILWPSIMSVCLIVISGYLYQHLGAFENIDSAQQPANPHAGMDTAQIMMQRVQMMEAQVKAEPENSQLWFSLGHAYVSANQYDKAIAAFDKVIELVGKHAELLGPKATAMYYKAGQQMTPQIQALIDESLAMDAQDPSTLLLVGMDAFFTADYKKAITSWQTILDSGRADVDRAALMNAIETANLRMQSETAGMPNDAHKQVKASAKSVNVTISISAELAAKASPEDTIFIFARATEGPKVPLAATKVSAKSFPITVTLDDSSGMGGDVKLSDAANVEVIAVLSKQGNIKPQTGDIQGKISKVAVGDTANLVLDTQVQ